MMETLTDKQRDGIRDAALALYEVADKSIGQPEGFLEKLHELMVITPMYAGYGFMSELRDKIKC